MYSMIFRHFSHERPTYSYFFTPVVLLLGNCLPEHRQKLNKKKNVAWRYQIFVSYLNGLSLFCL